VTCEFCAEFSGDCSRFRRIYGLGVRRIVRSYGEVVVIPTIGQMFPASMLVVPTQHVETTAEAGASVLEQVDHALRDLSGRLAHLGRVLVFEHGARRCTKSGCGVYHAHIHVLPLPGHVSSEVFLPNTIARRGRSLSAALGQLADSENYFLCQDTYGRVAFCDAKVDPDAPWLTSQFGRRTLAAHFGLRCDWDWRSYLQPEPGLLDALRLFGEWHVPVGN
jgi:diadenosine tetraphosphate (Ap4A) HIT family hydrolase